MARSNVDIRLYRVIYDAINEIETAMKGMLAPKYKEVVLGHAEVRQVIKVSRVGTVCGSYVTDGKMVRNSSVRIIRDNIVIHEGEMASAAPLQGRRQGSPPPITNAASPLKSITTSKRAT